ncbi:hypothetical protein B0T22DRAFT_525606 [Podospora appendiculata]|uniref:DUF7924 domain-containing protein n=1 Tax=Podospora appendiculata TaxID=314037 RepID=A0AAE0XGR8_9PEZI|nr:hypothetical protein B0T22DRAFT_525606 [Podospora appendiculata]
MGKARAQTATPEALPSTEFNYSSTCSSSDGKRKHPTDMERALEARPNQDPNPDPDPKRRRTSPLQEQHWPEENSTADSAVGRLPLARKKSSSNLTSTTPCDQRLMEKSVPYQDERYETLLEIKGSFIAKAPSGLTAASQSLCQSPLETTSPVPSDSLFRDDVFDTTCQRMRNENKARVIQDISRLIVPSAGSLATFGAVHLDILTESVNEAWSNSIPFTSTQPHPDYSVGSKRDAFTKDQLDKLAPFIGDFIAGDQSFFMATYYFTSSLNIADRQNAYRMTLAVRAIVEIFRTCKREEEVNRKILALSVSHEHASVQIYGHYQVIDGKDTQYYRHPIRKILLTELDGRDKWTAYRFTRNVYDMWMPKHFEDICSAIDQLPTELDFDVPPLSEAVSTMPEQRAAMVTPDTSFSGAAKRRKGRELVD